MARKPSPWYWPERNGWYTILNGHREFLAAHPPEAPPPTKRAGKWVIPQFVEQVFYKLLATPQTEKPASEPSGLTVAEIFDKYLDWCKKHRQPRTFDWYRDHIQDFLDWKPEIAYAAAKELKPYHLVEWADSHGENWSGTYRRGGIIAIQRPFNWAVELGYIAASPVSKVPKPPPKRRENPITPEDFAVLIDFYPDGDPFRELLVFAWYSGCRPQEATHLEARHVQLNRQCIVIPKDEAKGKKRDRLILLHGPALDIVTRLVAERPDGKLFRNEDGVPWKKSAIAKRFERFQLCHGIKKLKELGIMIPPLPRFNRRKYKGRAALEQARKEQRAKLKARRAEIYRLARQHVKRFAAYDLRHGFCQRKLEQGVHHLVVAELMGHATGRMVAETYSHMNAATDHLMKALEEAPGG
jgi:integrase